jgi:hypothetical protein
MAEQMIKNPVASWFMNTVWQAQSARQAHETFSKQMVYKHEKWVATEVTTHFAFL